MEVTRILAEIDAQIAKLHQVRAFLTGSTTTPLVVKRPVGRPRKTPLPLVASPKKAVVKRALSPDARKRIADAQKRRWAESRKASA